ncbi:hypothetical protein DFH08DRAFT_397508 [Mycena albidolilacea]|uniref:Uncharacterized protein n=1 Tax=Mycena albidolilacea TaxID=1033008 RepID=A0AAD7EEX2_9AGAR|nr:hypothetical protein DFH08DRAFT_397508 [Mycena albidolilacea]
MTCIATIRTAHCPRRPSAVAHKATARLLNAPRAYDLTPTLYHFDTHLTSAHHRYASAVIPRCARCLLQRQSSAQCSWISDPTPERGPRCIHSPSHTLFPSPPARDDHLWDYPTLFFPNAWSSRAAPLTGVAHPHARAPIVPVALVAVRHTTTVFSRTHLSAPAPPCIPSQVYTTTGVPSARHGRSFSRRATRCLRARCDVFGAIPLQACIRHSAETRRAASASSAPSAAPVANCLRRLRRLTACCPPASPCRAPTIQCASLVACACDNPSPAPRAAPPPVLRPFSPLQAPSIACAAPPICTPTAFSHRRRLSYPCRRDDPLRHPKLDTTHLRALRYYPHRRRLRSAQLRDPRRAVRPSSARDRRAHAAGSYPAVGACSHCGHGAHVDDSSNAISDDFFDTVLCTST